MKKYRVVCIDDDDQFLQSLESVLPEKVEALCPDFRCDFQFASSSEELFEVIGPDAADDSSLAMVISDQMMTGISGIELIEKLKGEYPNIVTVLLTGHGGLDSAKYAINRQLLDQYISKPIEDISVFVSLISNLLKRHHLDLEERERTEQLVKTVMQLRSSNEEISTMQAAAEEIVMLSKCFKGLDFDEVVSVASREVPRLFKAERAFLCVAPESCPLEVGSRHGSPGAQEQLLTRDDMEQARKEEGSVSGAMLPACAKLGGMSRDLVIPLSIGAFRTSTMECDKKRAYLCMCNMDHSIMRCPGLIKYKAGLVSEVLNASLANAELYQQVKHDSETDYLTGAKTRRVLEEKLEAEHERALRYKHPFCVILVDVDGFKRINDSSGHICGDNALRQLGGVLAQQMRQTDILARYGGDEFVILMPETDLADAVRAAERMRKGTEAAVMDCGQNLTISCGVAAWSGDEGQSGTDVLRRADEALHRAKRSGRNNVQAVQAA